MALTTLRSANRLPSRPQAIATRQRLMKHGRRAFASKGLAGATLVDDILRPANVSTGSFYHQFRDKNELLVAILDEHERDFRSRQLSTLDEAGEIGRADFTNVARACYALVFNMADDDGDLLRIHRRESESDDPIVAEYLKANHDSWVEGVANIFHRNTSDDHSYADCRFAAEFVIQLAMTSVALYQDLSVEERPAARQRLLEALVRFTMGGLPALVKRHPDLDASCDSASEGSSE